MMEKEEVTSKWQVLRWYIYSLKFGMVFIDPEFSIVKCLVAAESALLGCFWVVFWT